MVKHLLARSVRSNLGLLGIILAVLAMYGGIIVTMYDPELGDTLNSMAAAMPELFAAFGMAGTPATLTEFLVNYLYGFLLLVFPLVMSILLANRLVASYVDSGAVAYLLASPHSRAAITATQAVVHIVSNWICLAIFYGGCSAFCEMMFPGELDWTALARVTLGLAAMHFFFGGLLFASVCIFNDAKPAVGVGTSLTVLFLLIQMAEQVSDKFDWLQYLTPVTLYRTTELMEGTGGVWQACVLAGAGFVMYLAGGIIFCRKDISA